MAGSWVEVSVVVEFVLEADSPEGALATLWPGLGGAEKPHVSGATGAGWPEWLWGAKFGLSPDWRPLWVGPNDPDFTLRC